MALAQLLNCDPDEVGAFCCSSGAAMLTKEHKLCDYNGLCFIEAFGKADCKSFVGCSVKATALLPVLLEQCFSSPRSNTQHALQGADANIVEVLVSNVALQQCFSEYCDTHAHLTCPQSQIDELSHLACRWKDLALVCGREQLHVSLAAPTCEVCECATLLQSFILFRVQ